MELNIELNIELNERVAGFLIGKYGSIGEAAEGMNVEYQQMIERDLEERANG